MLKHIETALILTTIVALLSLVGCKASEAPSSGFVQDPELMRADSSLPFQRVYWNKKFDPKAYNELLVAPVDTHYVMAQNIWEKASAANISHEQIEGDVAKLAAYTQESFVKAATDDPKHRFTVVQTAGPKTLILELALVQLVPSKPALNAIGYVSFVPAVVTVAGSMGTRSEDTGKGVVAIEGRIRDGATGEIIGMFADRERPPTAIVDLKALTWWEPAKTVVDEWSRQLIAVANRPPGAVVKDAPAFELMVW